MDASWAAKQLSTTSASVISTQGADRDAGSLSEGVFDPKEARRTDSSNVAPRRALWTGIKAMWRNPRILLLSVPWVCSLPSWQVLAAPFNHTNSTDHAAAAAHTWHNHGKQYGHEDVGKLVSPSFNILVNVTVSKAWPGTDCHAWSSCALGP